MYGNAFLDRSAQVRLVSLELVRMSHLSQQYLRPNTITTNGQVYDRLSNLLSEYNIGGNTNNIPTAEIAKLTGDFMLPSSNVETVGSRGDYHPVNVMVPNGWESNRFIFYLVVEILSGGTTRTEYITGYTDRADTTRITGNALQGHAHIAPDTTFFINNVTTLNTQRRIADSFSVHGGGLGVNAYEGHRTHRMTPYEMYRGASTNVVDGLSSLNTRFTYHDARDIGNTPAITNRVFNSPTSVVSSIVSGYVSATAINNGDGFNTAEDLINNARASLSDPSYAMSRFLTKIMVDHTTQMSTFQFSWLTDIDPTIGDRARINSNPARTMNPSESWVSSTLEAQMAFVVSNMVGTLMTSANLSRLAFSSTNMNAAGQFSMGLHTSINLNVNTQVSAAIGISAENLAHMVNPLAGVINTELIPIISRNGERDYRLAVKASLNGMVEIEIAFGQRPSEFFEFPLFADSLISPLLTTNAQRFTENSRDIGTLLSDVGNYMTQRAMQSMQVINGSAQPGIYYPDNGRPQQPMNNFQPTNPINPTAQQAPVDTGLSMQY